METKSLALALCSALAALAGCGGDDNGSGGTVASGSIGPSGGTVEVPAGSLTLAGTRVEVPAGALTQSTVISISDGTTSQTTGLDIVGPAALFSPEGTQFASNVTVTLPFNASLVPGSTSGLSVQVRDAQGQVSQLAPTQIGADTVTFETDHFSTYWVVTPFVITEDYLPLEDGSQYDFENGVVATVSLLDNEPNLGGQNVYGLEFTSGTLDEGTYLTRQPNGDTSIAGNYSMSANYQEVLETDALWLPQETAIGGQTTASNEYTGYEPYGTELETYSGNQDLTTTFVSQGSLATPLGTFTDVIEVRVVRVYMGAGSRGTSGMTTNVLWLARDVGPVQVQLDGSTPVGLTSGHVGIMTIVPQ